MGKGPSPSLRTRAECIPEDPSLLVGPAEAGITPGTNRRSRLHAPDHGDREPASARPIPVERARDAARFPRDGARTKAIYYVVEFAQ